MATSSPRAALAIVIPLVIVAVGAVQLRRHGPAGASEAGAKVATRAATVVKQKVTPKKHKPKSYARYFVISLLIRALEHERSRKAVVGGLKIALRRA